MLLSMLTLSAAVLAAADDPAYKAAVAAVVSATAAANLDVTYNARAGSGTLYQAHTTATWHAAETEHCKLAIHFSVHSAYSQTDTASESEPTPAEEYIVPLPPAATDDSNKTSAEERTGRAASVVTGRSWSGDVVVDLAQLDVPLDPVKTVSTKRTPENPWFTSEAAARTYAEALRAAAKACR